MRERIRGRKIPNLCAYRLDRAEAILREIAPEAQVRIVRTAPPRRLRHEGALRVLRQRVVEGSVVELLVAAEDGCGPVPEGPPT